MSNTTNASDNKSVASRDSVSSDYDDNKITESIPFPTDDLEPDTLATRLINSEKSRSTSLSIKPVKDHRRRRSSSIISHVEPESIEDETDQQLSLNANVLWIDQRGAWLGALPDHHHPQGHHLTAVEVKPLHAYHGNVMDVDKHSLLLRFIHNIDHGEQFTPARKFLILFPIGLFLISTHYSRFSLMMFIYNFVVCVCIGVIPKLPWTHKLRIRVPGISGPQTIS
ncbi:unnamed protein product [Hanseniaspora opuntiae]